jgi:hypothetical protein
MLTGELNLALAIVAKMSTAYIPKDVRISRKRSDVLFVFPCDTRNVLACNSTFRMCSVSCSSRALLCDLRSRLRSSARTTTTNELCLEVAVGDYSRARSYGLNPPEVGPLLARSRAAEGALVK